MGGVQKKNEPRQSDSSPRVYHQAPRANSLGGPYSQPALHSGRVAQAQDRLVRCHSSPAMTILRQKITICLFSRYKNNVLIDAKAHPEKYTVESTYNMHSLEIKK